MTKLVNFHFILSFLGSLKNEKWRTFRKNYWKFHINYEKFYKFCRTLFHKCLYPQFLNSFINLYWNIFLSVLNKKLLHFTVSDENFGRYHARHLDCPVATCFIKLQITSPICKKKFFFSSSDISEYIYKRPLSCLLFICPEKNWQKFPFFGSLNHKGMWYLREVASLREELGPISIFLSLKYIRICFQDLENGEENENGRR